MSSKFHETHSIAFFENLPRSVTLACLGSRNSLFVANYISTDATIVTTILEQVTTGIVTLGLSRFSFLGNFMMMSVDFSKLVKMLKN